jgi:hypothetical protein
MMAAIAYFELWQYLSVPVVLMTLVIGDYFTRQVRIANGRVRFEVWSAVTLSLEIDITQIEELKFRAMSVEVRDNCGTTVVMDIGWYTAGQLDRILACIRTHSQNQSNAA